MRKSNRRQISDMFVKVLQSNRIMFVLLLGLGMGLAVITKFEVGWDFINYHYYNAFAFLNDRLNYDIAPASLHTYFNPIIELPWYFIIEYFNDMPNVAYALQGIWFGLLLFVFFKFSRLFFELKTGQDALALVAVLAVAIMGQATFFQIGTSTNEIQMALLELAALYGLFLMIKEPIKQRGWLFFISGLILGAALGLKPTVIYICLSIGLSLMLCYKYLKKPIVFVSLFALGGLIGYLVTNGWWMYKMWHLYQNPFFPFANGVFHSPYFDDANFADKTLIPPLLVMPFYPLLWVIGRYKPTEWYFFDLHAPLFYLFGVGCLVYILSQAKVREKFKKNRIWCFYAVFLVLSYVLWLSIFAIVRYLVIIEMMSAIFFVKLIKNYLETKGKYVEFVVAMLTPLVIALFLVPFVNKPWTGRTDNSHLIEVEELHLPENTLLKLYGLPLAGFIPVWAKNNDFRVLGYSQLHNIHQYHSDFAERGEIRKLRDKVDTEHVGPVVVVYQELPLRSKNYERFHQALDKEIAGMDCRALKNNFVQVLIDVYICVPPEFKDMIFSK